MKCLVVGLTAQQRTAWVTALENLGDAWHAAAMADASAAYQRLADETWDLCVLCAGPEAAALALRLQERPPTAAPWVIAERTLPTDADAHLDPPEAAMLPALTTLWERAGHLPRLTLTKHQQITCLARGMLNLLGVKHTLRAWECLPDMAALTVVHPALLNDLRARLYPLTARRHGMTPAAVERSLRLTVESTWSRGSLAALERFFGQSVDPERGKPTNREFLFQVQERLTLAAQRLR